MRAWDEIGLVRHVVWTDADQILPHIDVLILSLEDINNEISRLFPWFAQVPLIVVTEYRDGSTVYQRQPNGAISMFARAAPAGQRGRSDRCGRYFRYIVCHSLAGNGRSL